MNDVPTTTIPSGGSDHHHHKHNHKAGGGGGRACNGVPTIQSNRRACGFYIWNAPSALLYKWCHHLLKDHLYEGKGGHMFVRYESNSILQLLYPCSRYSPNRCLTCGGNFPDHLELWWSKHLYTPYDRHLDQTYQKGLVLPDDDETQNETSKRRKRNNKSKSSQPKVMTGPPRFNFHKNYVQDVSDWVRGEKDTKKQMEIIREKLGKNNNKSNKKKNNKNNNNNNNAAGTTMRLTRFPRYDVAYIVQQPPATKKTEGGGSNSFVSMFLRSVALTILDDLIMLQESENKKLAR